jgi:hypothetical protein
VLWVIAFEVVHSGDVATDLAVAQLAVGHGRVLLSAGGDWTE